MQNYLNNLIGIRPRSQLYISSSLQPPRQPQRFIPGELAGIAAVSAEEAAIASRAARVAVDIGDAAATETAILRARAMAVTAAVAGRTAIGIAEAAGVPVKDLRIATTQIEKEARNASVDARAGRALLPEETAIRADDLARLAAVIATETRRLANIMRH